MHYYVWFSHIYLLIAGKLNWEPFQQHYFILVAGIFWELHPLLLNVRMILEVYPKGSVEKGEKRHLENEVTFWWALNGVSISYF